VIPQIPQPDLKPFAEWLEGAPTDEWIVEGLIPDSAGELIAHQKIGKTLLAADLAVALARNESEWLGRKIRPGSGPVVFLVTDPRAEREIARRVHAMGAPEGSVIVGRLRRGPAPVEWWQQLADTLRGARLVIVDSGTNLVHDIIKPELVNPLFDGLGELTQANIPVLLIHHAPKSGNSAAGVYIWESWPRWLITMSGTKGSPYRTLSCDGNAVTELPPVLVIKMPRPDHPGSRFRMTDGRNDGPEDRSPERASRDDERLRLMIEGQPWGSQEDIAKSLGVSQKTVSRTLGAKGFALDRTTGMLAPAREFQSVSPPL
jgi:hypothetical protein